MKRHHGIIVAGTAILALATGAVLIAHVIKQRRELEREALRIASEQLSKSISIGMPDIDAIGPQLDCVAKLDGDVTNVTFTITNRVHLVQRCGFRRVHAGEVSAAREGDVARQDRRARPGRSVQGRVSLRRAEVD